MASQPPQPDKQGPEQTHPSQAEPATSPTDPDLSITSTDSDAVFIESSAPQSGAKSDIEQPPPLRRSSTFGIKKCWICICDSTEDDPNNPPVWREPCKCKLVAHEACLLDWIAEVENPKNRRSQTSKVQCPQCKTEIKIARPHSYLVNAVRGVDRSLGRLVLPGLGVTVMSAFYFGAWAHGFQSVQLVFGEQQARDIFKQAMKHKTWLFAYALIPVNLVFARTSLAEFVLPSGTLFLLSTQIQDGLAIDMTVWPPRPSTVFGCLPAIRSLYNWTYNKMFGELNKKWMQEVQPRQGTQETAGEENQAQQEEDQNDVDGGRGIVLELQVNLGEEEQDDDIQVEAGEAGNAPQGNIAAGEQNQNGQVRQILGDRGDEILDGAPGIGQTILGALLFPAVASGMGHLLSLTIPKAWMSNSNFMNGRAGLLRHKWGRSVVGGCLFVVLKDALVLYCRWKLAQGHRKRKIMNFDKQKKIYVP